MYIWCLDQNGKKINLVYIFCVAYEKKGGKEEQKFEKLVFILE